MNFHDGNLLLLYWLILILLGIIEWVFSAKWSPGYLRMGIPVFIRRIPVKRHYQFWLLTKKMPEVIKGNPSHPTIIVKSLNQNEIAFQNKAFSFDIGLGNQKPYRGIIQFHPEMNMITFKGLLPWIEPFNIIGVLWYVGFFLPRMNVYIPEIESVQDYLVNIMIILAVIRGMLALSYYKFSNKILELLPEANLDEELELQ